MQQGRYLPRSDYMAIKAATRDLMAECGGVTRCAQVTRSDAGNLSRYGNPQEGQFMPLDVAADLEAECGDPIVTRCLASLSHVGLVDRPRPVRPADHVRAIGDIAREVADVISAQSSAAADGVIDESEAAEVVKEALEAIAALEGLIALHRSAHVGAKLREVV